MPAAKAQKLPRCPRWTENSNRISFLSLFSDRCRRRFPSAFVFVRWRWCADVEFCALGNSSETRPESSENAGHVLGRFPLIRRRGSKWETVAPPPCPPTRPPATALFCGELGNRLAFPFFSPTPVFPRQRLVVRNCCAPLSFFSLVVFVLFFVLLFLFVFFSSSRASSSIFLAALRALCCLSFSLWAAGRLGGFSGNERILQPWRRNRICRRWHRNFSAFADGKSVGAGNLLAKVLEMYEFIRGKSIL